MNAAGQFAVAWANGTSVHLQLYHADGSQAASPVTLKLSSGSDAFDAHVGMDGSGNVVVSWIQTNVTGRTNTQQLRTQRYSASGTAQGGTASVVAYTGKNAYLSNGSVAMAADGSYVLAWAGSANQSKSVITIMARRYGNTGTANGNAFALTGSTANNFAPAVATDPSGDFVIAWMGPDLNFYATTYDSSGTQKSPSQQVNTLTVSSTVSQSPSVAMDQSGDFVVTYPRGINSYARLYSAAAAPLTDELQVNSTASADTPNGESGPQAAMDGAGNFVIVWQGGEKASADGFPDVYGRRYSGP
jgi:hypothetical protein